MLLMIDNYDSFTYNLVQYFGELGEEVRVFRNDEITLDGIARAAARRAGALARAVHAGRGRHLRRGDRGLRRQAADPRRLPRPPGDRRGARRHASSARRRRCTARPSVITTDGRGVFAGAAAALHGDPLPLARDRARDACRDALEVTATAERRRDHGRAPSRARGDEDAARGRAVPSRIDPHRARPRDAARTSWRRRDERMKHRRPAQRHGHAADAGDARGDGRRRGRRRRLRRRPDRQRAAGAASPRCSARRRRCSSPSGTQGNLVAMMSALRPRRRVHRRPDGAHLPLRRPAARAVLGSVQPQPLDAPAGRHAARWPTSRRAIKPDDAHFARTPAAVPREHDRRQGAAAGLPGRGHARSRSARGLATHLDGARLFNAAVALGGDARATRARSRRRSTASRSASRKGLGAPVGSALVGSRELHRRARTAGARCSAAACARPACSPPRRCTRSTTTSSASPRTTRWRGAWPPGSRACPASRSSRRRPTWSSSTCAASAPAGWSRT